MNKRVVTYKILQITFVVHEHTQNVACDLQVISSFYLLM